MDQHHAAEEEEYSGYGTPTPEQEMPGREAQQADQRKEEDASTSADDGDGSADVPSADVPSADAELDESNSEQKSNTEQT